MIKDQELYARLADVCNSEFGTSGPGEQLISTAHVKLKPLDETTLTCTCQMIVQYPSLSAMRTLNMKYRDDALRMITAAMKKTSESYKDKFQKKLTLKLSEKEFDETVEHIGPPIFGNVARAFYRLRVFVDVVK